MAALQHSWLSSLNTTALLSSSNHQKNSPFKVSFSQNQPNDEASMAISPKSEETTPESAQGPVDPIKLAFERAKAYKKTKVNPDSKIEQNPGGDSGGDGKKTDGSKETSASVKVAMEKAREYKENTGVPGGVENSSEGRTGSGKKTESEGTSQQSKIVEKKVQKKEKLSISSISFVGLDFADKKKSRGLPPGLVPVSDPFPEGDLPDVEIIVGDTSKFEEATTSEPKQNTEDNLDIYKPKVSTWGVFPRPGNISKTFGGGRTIRPGELLETEEDRAAKNERTRQLLAAYKKKVGLNVDPKIRSECDKALEDGDSLMDSGKLKEALSHYERVMEKMPYQSELHGLAALQWSICQDSLRRPNEARIMYEKLQSHPNAKVSKKAREFMFSFKAMEMMKVTDSNLSLNNTGYQNYFEAFIEDKTNYSPEGAEVTEGFPLRMVQRKVPNKLGIQADHIKPEKRLGSFKPSSCQHQDGKNKGTDLKKKMKKSRSIKLSDIEGLRSSPLRKTIAQPGKPPPPSVPAAAATPQKKSMIKAIDGSPNYMKSTNSSEAKKEGSQVSSRNTQTGSDSKSLRRRSSTGSKISSGSSNKLARTLTRTSSLKLVRTLTKSPTFKPVRASAKKCSRVAVCTDMNVQRATCSSTLKDSNFPAYLMLNPGETESEGTSVIKVCPYTYCSLNGHHHTPLPPLKCFLKARRRSLKTQRSMKMEALSPRRLKPSADGAKEFDEEQVVFGKEPASNGVDLGNSPMSPLMQEGPMDFFIEIYAKSKENDVEATRGSTQMNAKGMDDSGCCNETAPEHDTDKPVSESLFEGSPHSEIDFDENLEHCGDIISKVDITETLHEELKHNYVDEAFRGILVKEESSPWNFTDGDKQEGVSSVDVDHTMFEVIDMEWEEWLSASEPGDEAHSSMESDDESDLNIGDSSESHRNNLRDEFVISSDESDSNIAEEILAYEAEQVFEEDTACIDTCSQVSETLCYNQVSSTEEMFEVLVAMEEEVEEENTETDLIGIVTTPFSREKFYEEPTSGKEKMLENGVPGTVNEVSEADSPLKVPENSCSIDLKDEVFESTEQFQLHSFDKLEQDETNEDYNVIQKLGDSEADQIVTISDFCPEKEFPSGEAGKVADAKLLIGIHDSSHILPGADEDDNNEVEDNQNNQLCEVNNAIDERFSTQDTVDESHFAESQDHLSDCQHENTHVVDNQSVLEEDQDEAKFKVPTSMDSEEHNSSRMHETSLAEGSEEVGKMELEDNGTPGLDVAETFPVESDKTSHKPRNKFSFTRSNAKEELPDNHNNRKWTIRRKSHEENYEESRKFNPQEPNFLPVVLEPDAEKVDLKHQMMDERKNAEEWMLDHALQQAVTKLAPARKRKVALLVEAFETVLPITKCETHLRNTSTGFAHGQPIQACN
ncbi:hypothetical protein CRYUN_Cryun01aG0023500 [Craigia yunnanensis]